MEFHNLRRRRITSVRANRPTAVHAIELEVDPKHRPDPQNLSINSYGWSTLIILTARDLT